MKPSDRYLKIVRWSEQDSCYVGTYPGVMHGGVHGDNEVSVYRELCQVVDEWLTDIQMDGAPLPPSTLNRIKALEG